MIYDMIFKGSLISEFVIIIVCAISWTPSGYFEKLFGSTLIRSEIKRPLILFIRSNWFKLRFYIECIPKQEKLLFSFKLHRIFFQHIDITFCWSLSELKITKVNVQISCYFQINFELLVIYEHFRTETSY